MAKIEFATGALDAQTHLELTNGLESHSQNLAAPTYNKQHFNWTLRDEQGKLIAALTADLLWDWLYISELWVDESCRGCGMGSQLMQQAEQYAQANRLTGLWLWTQSWQAPDFYKRLGFEEFTTFDHFPVGHRRIGLRKMLLGSEDGSTQG
ncbi:GNAT family N-acetyltransferase [Vibrio panuliri]|uniref:Histone acetyltransferase n=1 Tax=Vibrio panuliri TaxID=1381081 RepID=A0ABX3FT52_9VIBR|nr:GNAT family N-acetyltransferase [Vibrio panuliri]KAB1457962.1 GNAT family N-acetyltransferase [Vibrio panuliri]OLQ96399.1 histone acetyltransferase [Vibrio panuliri]